jgi:membrane-associated phospholipid phosphatase
VMSDSHWPTDVALGSTVGAVSGFLVPRLLHYGFGAPTSARVAIGPLLTPTTRGLSLAAAF